MILVLTSHLKLRYSLAIHHYESILLIIVPPIKKCRLISTLFKLGPTNGKLSLILLNLNQCLCL